MIRAGLVFLGLLGVAGLALLAAALWPVNADAPAVAAGTSPPDLGHLAAADSGEALSRPLFDPGRRPWTARGNREDITAGERPRTLLTVRGILIEDHVRRALVADGSGVPAWLVPGQGRDGWRLVSVEPGRVVVADAARHYTLAFLGPPVALRPPPRHPAAEEKPPSNRGRAAARRIEITRPATP